MAIIARLASPLPKYTLGYLSLFRPGKRALGWAKALRLAHEIEQLTALGYIKLQGRIDRNCPATIWARAMEQMVEQRATLNLPMPNHNYLKKVAYDLADQADFQGEKSQQAVTRKKTPAPTFVESGEVDPRRDPMEMARREYDKKHGTPDCNVVFKDLSSVVKGMD